MRCRGEALVRGLGGIGLGVYRWYIDYWWYIGGIGLSMMLSFEM